MRGLALILGILTVTMVCGERIQTQRRPASEREPSGQYTCRLVTGYGTAIGRGSSKLKAKEAAMEICGSKLIDDYYARRGKIDDDAELELACINLECS
jgi:hypothetical protein